MNKFLYRQCVPCCISLHPTVLHDCSLHDSGVRNEFTPFNGWQRSFAALSANDNAHRARILLIDFPNRLNIEFYFIEMWPTSPSGVSYPTLCEPYRFLIVPFVLGTDFIRALVSAARLHTDSDILAERLSGSRTSSMPFRGSHL